MTNQEDRHEQHSLASVTPNQMDAQSTNPDQYIVCVTHIHIALMLTICGRYHRFDSIDREKRAA